MRQFPPAKASKNETEHPYIIELTVSAKGLDVELGRQIMNFHKTRHIEPRHGRNAVPKGASDTHYRWCFSDLATARDFVEEFGGAFYKTSGT